MKGMNRQEQRLKAHEKKQENATKRRTYESDISDAERLDIIARYNRLSDKERRGGIQGLFADMSDAQKKTFLHHEIKSLRAKETLYLNKLQKLDGLEPEKPPLPLEEQKIVTLALHFFMDKGYKRVTYIMLKRVIIKELSHSKGVNYSVTSSVTQMKTFLKDRFNIDLGPRVYVSVSAESKDLPEWLDTGPIELFGGCVSGEQRTHWIDLTKGYLADQRKEKGLNNGVA